MATLNERQSLFARHYADCLNATKAAIRAGYAEKGAAVHGHGLLRNPNVAKEIRRLLALCAMPREEVVARLARIARSDMEDFVKEATSQDADGNLTKVVYPDMATAKAAGVLPLVKKMKQGRFGIEFELYDAQAALNTLARITGLIEGGRDDDDNDDSETEEEAGLTARDLATEQALMESAHG